MLSKKRYEEIKATITPQSMLLNLTDQCNLRCYYCFVEHAPHTMSFQTMKDATLYLLKKCNPTKPVAIDLFGGEPMLMYDSLIVPYLKWIEENHFHEKYNLRLGMTTNGTLLDEEKAKFLFENKLGILLSIDGDEKSQNYNRETMDKNLNSFEMVSKNIPGILKYFPNVTFRSTITPFTAKYMIDNYIFARNNGFRYMFMMPNSHESWDEESLKYLCKGILEIARIMVMDFENNQTPLWFSPIMSLCKTILLPPGGSKNEYSCGWGTVSFGVGTDGKIFGCQERSSHIKSDVFEIGDIYNGINESKHRNLLTPLEDGNLHVKSIDEECDSCVCRPYCDTGICQSHAEWNTGNLNTHVKVECVFERALMITTKKLLEYFKDNLQFGEEILRFAAGD